MSCNGQRALDTITLLITNRSHNSIDSIIFPHKQEKVKENLEMGKTFSVKISVDHLNIYSEGFFPVFIYQKNRKFIGQFGFHDWGTLAKKRNIYIFSTKESITRMRD